MIKIVFNSIGNQETAFKNTYNVDEGYLIPTEQNIIPISSEWNGTNYVIQNIIYDAYEFYIYLRDDLYTSFQNIQSSYKVICYETGDEARFLADEFEYIEHETNPFGEEFWEIKVKLRHLASKATENIIDKRISDILKIWNQEISLFECNVPFNYIDNINFTSNIINETKDKLIDFNKSEPFKQVRFYLNISDRLDFYEELKNIKNYSLNTILYKSVNYNIFTVEDRAIGENLFEIDLNLYSGNEITS